MPAKSVAEKLDESAVRRIRAAAQQGTRQMVGFVGRWISNALRLGLSLALALAAMQLPALAHQYAAALLQIAEDGRRDIEQRKAAARSFYPTVGETDEAAIAALRPVEPSNAQALEASIARIHSLRSAYDRLEATQPLLRPILALLEVIEDHTGDQRAILQTAVETHSPQVLLSTASAVYGVAGLLMGSFIAEVVVSIARAFVPRRSRENPFAI
ncbi:MAG: DUF2937 family protein [Acetobacteraceae bacterium]|nr:DUF2937 family protein [Acetobacteraceae bacterium]